MAVELLNEVTVLDYLISKGVIDKDERCEIEVLTGGVSNVVLGISSESKKLVLTSTCRVKGLTALAGRSAPGNCGGRCDKTL